MQRGALAAAVRRTRAAVARWASDPAPGGRASAAAARMPAAPLVRRNRRLLPAGQVTSHAGRDCNPGVGRDCNPKAVTAGCSLQGR